MCCFSRPVLHVAATRVFARGLTFGAQALVYSMSLAAREDLAMILPLPVPAGSPEDAVRFVDLEGYADFFTDVERAFPTLYEPVPRGVGLLAVGSPAQTLRVHAVGRFDASFVPALRDFQRLDPRFRLPERLWQGLPGYRDWGFAVFQLRAVKRGWRRFFGRAETQTIHPMAFVFPRRDPGALFFPTLHIHDGTVHAEADFDHTLYCQPDPLLEPALRGWEVSAAPLGHHVDAARCAGLVDGARAGHRKVLIGRLPNEDVVLTAARAA